MADTWPMYCKISNHFQLHGSTNNSVAPDLTFVEEIYLQRSLYQFIFICRALAARLQAESDKKRASYVKIVTVDSASCKDKLSSRTDQLGFEQLPVIAKAID